MSSHLTEKPPDTNEMFHFLNLMAKKQQEIFNEFEVFKKLGFDMEELYVLWDWTDDCLQIVPKCIIEDNAAK